MISKVDILKEKIIGEISARHLEPGTLLPSRHQYMRRYGCARGTIDAAINSLANDGYLYSRKGGGTYVATEKVDIRIRKICIVDNSVYSSIIERGIESAELAGECRNKMPTELFKVKDVYVDLDALAHPGNAIVWVRPSYEYFFAMNYLSNMSIPQLLLGRDFGEFDYVTTDAKCGILSGLRELQKISNDIFFISEENNSELPYIAERQIAFYQSAIELGVNINSDSILTFDRKKFTSEISRVGKVLFSKGKTPKAIFLTYSSAAIPLLTYAEANGKVAGRDFHILIFDKEEHLIGKDGVIMIHQQWKRMALLVEDWIKVKQNNIKEVFQEKVKPKIIGV